MGAAYQGALAEHREILRDAVASHAGREVDWRADEFLACFPRASDGLAAAIAAQLALVSQDSRLRVRMGLHTGEPELIGDAYVGIDVNRAARICSAGHGGQILVSQTTRDLVSTAVQFRDLGTYLLAGSSRPSGSSRCVPRGCAPRRCRCGPSTRPTPRRRRSAPAAGAGLVPARQRRVAGTAADRSGPLREPLTDLAAAI